jgi:hypothetical protein
MPFCRPPFQALEGVNMQLFSIQFLGDARRNPGFGAH